MYIATETRGPHLLFAVGAVVLACSNFSGFAGSLALLVSISHLVSDIPSTFGIWPPLLFWVLEVHLQVLSCLEVRYVATFEVRYVATWAPGPRLLFLGCCLFALRSAGGTLVVLLGLFWS